MVEESTQCRTLVVGTQMIENLHHIERVGGIQSRCPCIGHHLDSASLLCHRPASLWNAFCSILLTLLSMSVVGVKREWRDQSKLKHAVFGYIRRQEIDGYVYVPEDIKNMCANFFWLKEKFVPDFSASVLRLDEEGGQVHNWAPLCTRPRYPFPYRGQRVTGSVWIDADSQGISKCKWTLQITGGRELVIGIDDGQNIYNTIELCDRSLRSINIQTPVSRKTKLRYKELCDGLDSLDEVIMELDVGNRTLTFNIRASPRYTTRVEMRDLPKAKYHLCAVLGSGVCLRLKDFSIEHRTCSDTPVIPSDIVPVIPGDVIPVDPSDVIPVIPRDVHILCTLWIIRILLVVLCVIIDYQLNLRSYQMGYLWPKIIFTAALAFVAGIRYGVTNDSLSSRPQCFESNCFRLKNDCLYIWL